MNRAIQERRGLWAIPFPRLPNPTVVPRGRERRRRRKNVPARCSSARPCARGPRLGPRHSTLSPSLSLPRSEVTLPCTTGTPRSLAPTPPLLPNTAAPPPRCSSRPRPYNASALDAKLVVFLFVLQEAVQGQVRPTPVSQFTNVSPSALASQTPHKRARDSAPSFCIGKTCPSRALLPGWVGEIILSRTEHAISTRRVFIATQTCDFLRDFVFRARLYVENTC